MPNEISGQCPAAPRERPRSSSVDRLLLPCLLRRLRQSTINSWLNPLVSTITILPGSMLPRPPPAIPSPTQLKFLLVFVPTRKASIPAVLNPKSRIVGGGQISPDPLSALLYHGQSLRNILMPDIEIKIVQA